MKQVHAFRDDPLADLDAVGVARAIADGEFSAAEAAEAALQRLDAVNGELAAVAVDDRERALARAKDAPFSGVFAGVPTMIKNNTRFAGLPTRHGSAATPATVADSNEAFTDEFIGTGVNILGATTMPAFGLTATTEFVDREPTRNPWNTDYSCGASSGGAAALVAAGVLPLAHANDGGGSIRIPAAACGLVGLKPTRGRTAGAPSMETAPIDLVSNGIVSRSVRDSAYFLADLERQRCVDSLEPVGLVEGPSATRLRVALFDEPITGAPLDTDTARAVSETVELLESLGHRVEPIVAPVGKTYIDQFLTYWGMLAFGLDRFGGQVMGKGFDRSLLDPFTRGLSDRFLRSMYKAPWSIIGLKRSTGKLLRALSGYDVLLSPTLGHTTPEIGYLSPSAPFDEVVARLIRFVAFTPANNTSGTPAISLPLAQSASGLPIGLHFSAPHGKERVLLELAYELEAARPFARIQDAG